jgi:AraC family transcriptional activator of pyochelin receptor
LQLNKYDIECLEKAISLVQQDLAVRYTIPQLAGIAGMGATKFKLAFKMYKGHSVFEFVQQLRMQTAYNLVTENYYSVKTIAARCGFNHTSHFNAAFKKAFGISAKTVRSQLHR